jgi:hypothetical protein
LLEQAQHLLVTLRSQDALTGDDAALIQAFVQSGGGLLTGGWWGWMYRAWASAVGWVVGSWLNTCPLGLLAGAQAWYWSYSRPVEEHPSNTLLAPM